ncbi:hypothetical protein FGO68_gene488 [Halteria grandinella]|uniref:Peptidase M20 dimerisation domain-containing protein n=1 Tax=Halteria grandinella TaxID=5974 RepID=A0A8J8P566_HALGN|nr:hypothetical protein FGO68_gene488 [Halteria grandinella]
MNGRGSADDGYASFAIFTALKVCQDQGIKLPKITLVLETEEETDSAQLRNLLEQAKDIIGTPDYLICMDSGLVDYKHLWITSSLRGYCEFNLKVACGAQDYHSGEAGGIIPETFNVIRVLLDRLNDPKTGIFKEFQEDIPAWKYEEAKSVVQVVGDQIATKFKMEPGVAYQNTNLEELYLDNVWRPTLAIVGMEGVPNFGAAKNVIRASTSIRVGLRIPPSADPKKIAERIKVLMTTDVPFNAAAEILEEPETGLGWLMKAWEAGDPFKCKLEEISQTYFKSPTFSYGDGASIPFLKELELKYPNTRILALGVLGPGSNAHSKDETLDLNYAKSMICVLADIFKGITTLA